MGLEPATFGLGSRADGNDGGRRIPLQDTDCGRSAEADRHPAWRRPRGVWGTTGPRDARADALPEVRPTHEDRLLLRAPTGRLGRRS